MSAATGGSIGVQDVLQLVGAVEEDALFRLCDTVVDRDTAGALVAIEELAEQGQDLGRLVTDLIEHLRHLLLVQHVGHVPDSLPVTEETRDRLREQANQLPEPTVLRLIDLLAVAVDDMRQGGDPRLPLELALVKVTRPRADLSRESLAHRVEVLEERLHAGPAAAVSRAPSPVPAPAAGPAPTSATPTPSAPPPEAATPADEPLDAEPAPELELEQLQDAWTRSVLPAVRERSIPVATLLGEAHPVALTEDTVTLEFAPAADFHRKQVEDARNLELLREALHEVTGKRLAVRTSLGDSSHGNGDAAADEPLSEEDVLSLLKDTFDATEVEE